MAKLSTTKYRAPAARASKKVNDSRTPFQKGIDDSLKVIKKAIEEAAGRYGGKDLDGKTWVANPHTPSTPNTLWKVKPSKINSVGALEEVVEITWKVGGGSAVEFFEVADNSGNLKPSSTYKCFASDLLNVLNDMYQVVEGLKEEDEQEFAEICYRKYVPKSPGKNVVGVDNQFKGKKGESYVYDYEQGTGYVLSKEAQAYVDKQG